MMDGSITIIKDLFPCYKQGHHRQCNFLNLQNRKISLEKEWFLPIQKKKRKRVLYRSSESFVYPWFIQANIEASFKEATNLPTEFKMIPFAVSISQFKSQAPKTPKLEPKLAYSQEKIYNGILKFIDKSNNTFAPLNAKGFNKNFSRHQNLLQWVVIRERIKSLQSNMIT